MLKAFCSAISLLARFSFLWWYESSGRAVIFRFHAVLFISAPVAHVTEGAVQSSSYLWILLYVRVKEQCQVPDRWQTLGQGFFSLTFCKAFYIFFSRQLFLKLFVRCMEIAPASCWLSNWLTHGEHLGSQFSFECAGYGSPGILHCRVW